MADKLARPGGRSVAVVDTVRPVAAFPPAPHLFVMAQQHTEDLVAAWPLTYAATLGSSVRRQGLFLEIRARLSPTVRRSLSIGSGTLTLRMARADEKQFRAASLVIQTALEGIESLPILPREIENILQISSTERHRWLKDGRLQSVGTRTVNLRGRARQVTFHVFDPRVVEDLLDHDTVSEWRDEDAAKAAEKRLRAAWTSRRRRSAERDTTSEPPPDDGPANERPKLLGWDEFERDGPLRSH